MRLAPAWERLTAHPSCGLSSAQCTNALPVYRDRLAVVVLPVQMLEGGRDPPLQGGAAAAAAVVR